MKLNFKKVLDDNEAGEEGTSKPTVVIVDDERPNLFGLKGLLKDDYEVLDFESALKALSYLKDNLSKPIAAIISDHIMPEMTGLELFIELNKLGMRSPRILITGFAGLDNVISAVNEAGIYKYLQKPVDASEVLETVKLASAQYLADRKNQHLIDQLEKLIYQHQVDKIKDFIPLEQTMPVGTGYGCVISFDIQKSSVLGHDENHDFLEEVIRQCHEKMTKSYDKDTLVSEAYMIKELGDGFLCSVGFPFPSVGNVAEEAFLLSQEFVQVFKSLAKDFFGEDRLYCSLGLAIGKITGFFPRVGLRRYDVFGNSIVQATRYEAFRKDLFQAGVEEGNIIIIQEKVFEALSPDQRSQFKQHSLNIAEIKEDSDAKCLYYLAL